MLPVNVAAIPAELRSLPRWVTWRAKPRFGRPTKVPYTPTTGKPASVTDPKTWGTFAEASAAAARYDGVGFVLVKGDRIVGFDLDRCLDPDTGTMNAEARAIIDEVRSYSEVSPSGTGIRIFARGTLPGGGRKRAGIEIYDGGRFLTVTGAHLTGTPRTLEERTPAIAALHARLFGVEPSVHDGLPSGWLALVEKIPSLRDAWLGRGTDHADTSGSGCDMKLAHLARKYHFKPEQVKAILHHAPYVVGGGRSQAYLDLTVAKAFARPASQRQGAPFAPIPVWPFTTGVWVALSPSARAAYPLLCALSDRPRGVPAVSWDELRVRASMGYIATRSGIHRDRVGLVMGELERHHLIRRERAPGGRWNLWLAFRPVSSSDGPSEQDAEQNRRAKGEARTDLSSSDTPSEQDKGAEPSSAFQGSEHPDAPSEKHPPFPSEQDTHQGGAFTSEQDVSGEDHGSETLGGVGEPVPVLSNPEATQHKEEAEEWEP